ERGRDGCSPDAVHGGLPSPLSAIIPRGKLVITGFLGESWAVTRILTVAVASAVLAWVGACKEDAPKSVEIRPVRTEVIDPKPIDDDRQAVGEIKPRYETDFGFRLSGKLISRA